MASDTTTPTRRIRPSIMESHPLLRDLEVPSETIAPLLGRTQHGPDYRAVNESARTPARLTGLRSCCPPSLAPSYIRAVPWQSEAPAAGLSLPPARSGPATLRLSVASRDERRWACVRF